MKFPFWSVRTISVPTLAEPEVPVAEEAQQDEPTDTTVNAKPEDPEKPANP